MELFVRNQAKISLEFTDKALIFDDLSVNDGAFAKCSACSSSESRRDYGQRIIFERCHVWKPFVKNSVPAYSKSRTICD
ncbi:hypothetical protein [Ligilactobacillus ruminis]|uniref:hypothetical protein n=1 Tax=Ligilactobacillus ruminis TaxID=1623 RepID=UPI0022E01228|nr:hypothetical protein [Ligilactobacillus ruminis]